MTPTNTADKLAALYPQHLQKLQQQAENWLSAAAMDCLVIDSGSQESYYRNDIAIPYRAYGEFLRWLPLTDAPGSLLLVRGGEPPLLLVHQDAGFWHQQLDLRAPLWHGLIEQTPFSESDLKRQLQGQQTAYLGPRGGWATNLGIDKVNPATLLAQSEWYRAYKTPYEQGCMRQAAEIALRGHQAVAEGFAEGLSEWAMHLCYLQAIEQGDNELPYPNIIALNQHGAVLHYQQRDRTAPTEKRSLLIDAGASFRGYGTDISRSYGAEPGIYSDLIQAVEAAQQQLIAGLSLGQNYVEVHVQACLQMAAILQSASLVDMDASAQLETGLIQHFFPHGIGHLLGLQVHDVGGHLATIAGARQGAPAEHPFLRLTRDLQADMVFTIEPGIYFIDSLLQRLADSPLAAAVNWPLVDALRPYGGIRIEDNVLMTATGAEQLTR